ncbi:MAG: hypothetical protein R2734_13220 [Nocardioides sp.]
MPPPSTIDEQNDVELKARQGRRSDEPVAPGWLPQWARLLLVYAGMPLLGVLAALAGILLAKGGVAAGAAAPRASLRAWSAPGASSSTTPVIWARRCPSPRP